MICIFCFVGINSRICIFFICNYKLFQQSTTVLRFDAMKKENFVETKDSRGSFQCWFSFIEQNQHCNVKK